MHSKYIECPKCKGQAFLPCEVCFCPACISSSTPGKVKCTHCSATGKVRAKWLILSFSIQCPSCMGSGDVSCPNCEGTGHLPNCNRCYGTGKYICDECDGAGQILNEKFRFWVASLEDVSYDMLLIEYEKRQLELTKLELRKFNLDQQEYLKTFEFRDKTREFEERTEFFHAGDYFGDLYEQDEKAPDWNDWIQDINKSQIVVNKQRGIIQDELYIIEQILHLNRAEPNVFRSWMRILDKTLVDNLNKKADSNIGVPETIHERNLR